MCFIRTMLVAAVLTAGGRADDIQILQSVGDFSQNAAEAREARQRLVDGGPKNLLPILEAFQGSSLLATNWLRSAFESIADAELKAGRSLPKDQLVAFVKDTSEHPAARRLAYEWLLKRSPQLEEELIPGMLLDPGPEFRRDAVARLLTEAAAASGAAATEIYQRALQGAVHEDQVKKIAGSLRDAGVDVSIQRHFGFLNRWKLIGPFDNRGGGGFAAVYPPEKEIDLTAEYEGQLGSVTWQEVTTSDDYGVVDIAEEVENYKGSVMYATTTWTGASPQQLEFRLGTPNAWKLWVNGELVFEREEYHRGTRMDQYAVPVELAAGSNTILLKICQNEQDQPWAQKYQFQLRVCDATGAGVLPADRTAFQVSEQGANQ